MQHSQWLFTYGKNMTVEVDIFFAKEGGYWVVYCPALNLSSYGDSREDAHQAFDEAVRIFVNDTTAKGTLEKVLIGLGWKLQYMPKPVYDPPVYTARQVSEQLQVKPAHITVERTLFPITPAAC